MTAFQRFVSTPRVGSWIACAVVIAVLTACRAAAPASERVGEPRGDCVVVPLKHEACTELAATINDLLQAVRSRPPRSGFCAVGPPPSWPPQMGDPPEIVADPHSNSIVIRASDEDMQCIIKIISKLDVDPSEMREPVPR